MEISNIKFPICIWLLLTCLSLKSQDKVKTDSLLSLLITNPHDTVKIDLCLELGKNLASVDTASARDYFNRAIMVSKKTGDNRRTAMSYLHLGDYLTTIGSYNEAKETLEKAKKENQTLLDSKIDALYQQKQGMVSSFLGDYDQAIHYFFKALTGFEVIKDSIHIGQCYNNIGSVYHHLKKYDEALKHYHTSLEIALINQNAEGEGKALGNIGSIHSNKGDFDRAKEYMKQSLKINQAHGFSEDARINLHNIGRLFKRLNEPDSAMFYYTKAKELAVKIQSKRGILYANLAIAVLEREMGNYRKSEKILDEALPLAQDMGMKELIELIYLSYANNYEASGEYKLALDYRKRHESLYDSLINVKNLDKIKQLEIKYETEKKDQQITLLSQEKQLQEKETQRQATLKNVFIGGVISIALLAGLLFYTFRQRIKNQRVLATKNEEIKEVNFKRQLTELEMKALQAQINPHFIFNCMNSINQMILDGENKNASKYLTKFSKLIRMVLENAEETEVPLQNELDLLEAYIQLESLRFAGDIEYEIEVSDDLDTENTYLPSMVLQPFVENAIWHGLRHRKEKQGGKVSIKIDQCENQLLCRIVDNGVGRQKAFELQQKSVYRSKSMGLKITEERLRLLSDQVQEQLVKIIDLKDKRGDAMGTMVEVLIPIS